MPDVLEQSTAVTREVLLAPPLEVPAGIPPAAPDERAGRHSLLAQIERLESELASLFVCTWPRKGLAFSVLGRGGPRLLSLEELEALRDELVERVDHARRSLSDRTYLEEQNRRRIEEMLLEPEKHKWVRVANEDIGEPGCHHWHVQPRGGLLGMLAGWWRVRISSGCPLAGGRVAAP